MRYKIVINDGYRIFDSSLNQIVTPKLDSLEEADSIIKIWENSSPEIVNGILSDPSREELFNFLMTGKTVSDIKNK